MVDRDRNRDKVGYIRQQGSGDGRSQRAIGNALDPQKIEAYSASMISCDLRHEPLIIEYAPTAARFKPRRTHSASLAGQAMNRYRGSQAEFHAARRAMSTPIHGRRALLARWWWCTLPEVDPDAIPGSTSLGAPAL